MNLDLKQREAIKEQTLKHMTQQAYRTIALGYKDMSYQDYKRALGESLNGEVNTQSITPSKNHGLSAPKHSRD